MTPAGSFHGSDKVGFGDSTKERNPKARSRTASRLSLCPIFMDENRIVTYSESKRFAAGFPVLRPEPSRQPPLPTDKKSPRNLPLKRLIVIATLWDFLIVVFGMAFAPPFQGVTSVLALPDTLVRFFYPYEAMFFHALALPFVAVLVYATLLIFGTRGRTATFITAAVTAGFVLSSLSALYVMFTGANAFAYDTLWVGLGLGVLAALGLLLATWPSKQEGQPTMNLKGRNLASLCVWVSVLGVLSAAGVGVYASYGSSMWGSLATIQGETLLAATHEHAIITVVDASLVALIVKEFKADLYEGIPGLFVKIGLYGILVGIPTTTVATFATVPMGVAAHTAITAFAGILLQAALFVTYAIIYAEVKRLNTGILRGIYNGMMTFGLLFILFWVNVVVTLPGIYVAVNFQNFIGQPNEQAFITGHTHVLITLTALTLLMLVAHVYRVRGKLGVFGGTTLTVGYLISTSATVLYMFYDWNPITSAYIPYIGAGIILIVFGVLATLAGVAHSDVDPLAAWTRAGHFSWSEKEEVIRSV